MFFYNGLFLNPGVWYSMTYSKHNKHHLTSQCAQMINLLTKFPAQAWPFMASEIQSLWDPLWFTVPASPVGVSLSARALNSTEQWTQRPVVRPTSMVKNAGGTGGGGRQAAQRQGRAAHLSGSPARSRWQISQEFSQIVFVSHVLQTQ